MVAFAVLTSLVFSLAFVNALFWLFCFATHWMLQSHKSALTSKQLLGSAVFGRLTVENQGDHISHLGVPSPTRSISRYGLDVSPAQTHTASGS